LQYLSNLALQQLAQLFEPIKEVPQPKTDDAFTSYSDAEYIMHDITWWFSEGC
jgi:hypothetical protein